GRRRLRNARAPRPAPDAHPPRRRRRVRAGRPDRGHHRNRPGLIPPGPIMLRRRTHPVILPALLLLPLLLQTPARGDIGAREQSLMEQVGKRYRGLKSYRMSGTIRLETTGAQSQTVEAPFLIAAVSPNRIHDELRHEQLGMMRVCDGRNTWTYLASLSQ